jgi:hypothetical protein
LDSRCWLILEYRLFQSVEKNLGSPTQILVDIIAPEIEAHLNTLMPALHRDQARFGVKFPLIQFTHPY